MNKFSKQSLLSSKSVLVMVGLLGFFNTRCSQQMHFTSLGLHQNSILTAQALSYSGTVNTPVNIPKSDILNAVAAPSNTLSIVSVGQPLTDAGDHYVYVSSSAGSVSINYTVANNQGAKVSSVINIAISISNATGSYYACANGKLYELSANNQAILSVVNTTYMGGLINLDDLAINTAGEMYGKDLNNSIYRVDVKTGALSLVASVVPNSSGYLQGLTFLPDGTLGTFENGALISFNMQTMSSTVIEPTNYGMIGGDFKYLPDGNIYWTVSNATSQKCVNSTSGTQALVRLNPKTGQTVEIGCLDQPQVYGLGFANGTVYGFTNSGNVLSIDTSTAKTTIVASPGYMFWGAASNPALW